MVGIGYSKVYKKPSNCIDKINKISLDNDKIN